MTLAPGTTVGRYQILEPLGQGGMATVYKAYQPSLDREVALKVLRPGYAQDAEFRERFEREAKAVAKLRHPNIVQVHDFEIADGQFVLAMEFLQGGTLKDRLTTLAADGRGLDPSEAVRMIWEVADALSYAHEAGVIHRDVKPSNVMLAKPRERAVVTDFGIARILGATSHTQTGVGIGTPEYMAPEQGQGATIDHRADIYSLGAMAYELFTGRVPYGADTPLAVVLAHIKDPLPLPSKVNPTIGPTLERALIKALAKDPAQRFDSAVSFAEAVRDGVARDSAGGTLPTVVVRGATSAVTAAGTALRAPARPWPRTRLLAVVGAALVLLIGGAVLAYGALRTPAPVSAPQAVPSLAPTSAPTAPSASALLTPTPTAAAATVAPSAPAVAPAPAAALPSPTPGASVSPASGPAGTKFRVEWCCFAPNSDVTVVFTHPDGRNVPPMTTKAALDGTAVMGCCQTYFAGTWSATASGGGVTRVAHFTVTQ